MDPGPGFDVPLLLSVNAMDISGAGHLATFIIDKY